MPDSGRAPGRSLLPFAALSASYFAHIGFFNPYLPLWLKDMGLSLLAISVLTAMQSATRLFAPYAWGALSDHTGERVKLLRWGASVALLASIGLWVNLGVVWLAVVLLVMFTHTSAMMSMSEAAMAHLVSRGGTFDARRYGRVRLCGSLGFLLTVFLAGIWFQSHGMRDFPAWTALTLLAVVISVWRLPDQKDEAHGHQGGPEFWPVLRQPPVRWLFASLFFHVLSHMGIYLFFSLYLDSLGYTKTMIGLLWSVAVLAEIAWFFTQGQWLPRLSLTAWLVLCAGFTVMRMGLTALGGSILAVLLVAQLLNALTFAAHHSVFVALMSHHFPGRLRGRGQAIFTVVGYGSTGVTAGLGGGYLSQHGGLPSIFWATFGFSFVALACAFKVWRLQHPAISARG